MRMAIASSSALMALMTISVMWVSASIHSFDWLTQHDSDEISSGDEYQKWALWVLAAFMPPLLFVAVFAFFSAMTVLVACLYVLFCESSGGDETPHFRQD